MEQYAGIDVSLEVRAFVPPLMRDFELTEVPELFRCATLPAETCDLLRTPGHCDGWHKQAEMRGLAQSPWTWPTAWGARRRVEGPVAPARQSRPAWSIVRSPPTRLRGPESAAWLVQPTRCARDETLDGIDRHIAALGEIDLVSLVRSGTTTDRFGSNSPSGVRRRRSGIREGFRMPARRERSRRAQPAARKLSALGFAVDDCGRDARYWAPPAQNRTCGIPASGSHLGCLTAKRWLGQG